MSNRPSRRQAVDPDKPAEIADVFSWWRSRALPVKIGLVLAVGAVAVAALILRDDSQPPVGRGASVPDRASEYVGEYGGIADVYGQILSETDCAALQSQFDTAAANADRDSARGRNDLHRIDLGYMTAADDRMLEMGCHG